MAAGGLAVALAVAPVAVAAAAGSWLLWRLGAARHGSVRWLLGLAVLGLLAGLATSWVEAFALRWSGLVPMAQDGLPRGRLAAALLLSAPLAEAVKVGLLWPPYAVGRLDGLRPALSAAAVVAAAYAAASGAFWVVTATPSGAGALRAALSVPTQVICTGAWAYALGARRTQGRWFTGSWVVATLVHGLQSHLVWSGAPGALAVALALLAPMTLLAVLAVRDAAPSQRPSRLSLLPPTSLSSVRRAFVLPERPVLLRWILLGALVTLGAVMVGVGAAALVAQRWGLDFEAAAAEGSGATRGPLLLLLVLVGGAFPVSGWVIARASDAPDLTEPALGVLLAQVVIVVLLSFAAPMVVAFAVATAPVALLLACAGAWVGLARH